MSCGVAYLPSKIPTALSHPTYKIRSLEPWRQVHYAFPFSSDRSLLPSPPSPLSFVYPSPGCASVPSQVLSCLRDLVGSVSTDVRLSCSDSCCSSRAKRSSKSAIGRTRCSAWNNCAIAPAVRGASTRMAERSFHRWGIFAGNNFRSTFPITTGWCSPALPANVYDRSNPFGPSTFISQLSFAREPMIDTRQSPTLSLRACSTSA